MYLNVPMNHRKVVALADALGLSREDAAGLLTAVAVKSLLERDGERYRLTLEPEAPTTYRGPPIVVDEIPDDAVPNPVYANALCLCGHVRSLHAHFNDGSAGDECSACVCERFELEPLKQPTPAPEKPKRTRGKAKNAGSPGEGPAPAAGEVRARPEASASDAPIYDGPFLSQTVRGLLGSAGFRWTGKAVAPATEAQLNAALDRWCDNDDRNALASLDAAGWKLDPKIAARMAEQEAAGVGDAGK